MNEQQLVKLAGALTKPATLLIEKISEGAGILYEPTRRVRMAKAEAEATLIAAKTTIEITELHQRAALRWVNELGRQQSNIESIMEKSFPMLDDQSTPEQMENDWVANFFEKSKNISDDQMQQLWATILAGEANKPGSFSKRSINLLHDLDKQDAERFQLLCRFSATVILLHTAVKGPHDAPFTQNRVSQPFILELDDPIYKDAGLNFGILSELESIGLVRFNHLSSFGLRNAIDTAVIICGGKSYRLPLPAGAGKLDIGKAAFTRTGIELQRVCKQETIDGFAQYLMEKMPGMTELHNGDQLADGIIWSLE